MGMFNEGRQPTAAEEINYYLDKANAPDEDGLPEKGEAQPGAADKNVRSHADVLTLVIIAFVMLFFGAVFTALTDHQDFSEGEGVTAERIFSGSFFADVEKKFISSLPLRDVFHNAGSAINYCFGLGNETDFVELEKRNDADDPYSVSAENDYVPVDDRPGEEDDGEEGGDPMQETVPTVSTTDNKKNIKISGIKLTTNGREQESPEGAVSLTQLDLNPPPVTHTQGAGGPVTTTTPETTLPPDTETETSPTETSEEPFITRPTSSPDDSVPDSSTDSVPDVPPVTKEPTTSEDPFFHPAG